VAPTARSGHAHLSEHDIDVVLLDLGLPDGDGVALCREVRAWYRNPVIVITAEGDDERLIEALDAGADDYLTKPFSTPVLLARLRVAIRHRAALKGVVDPRHLVIGDLLIDTGGYVVEAAGQRISLTQKEFDFLRVLALNPGRLVRHHRIIEEVWGGTGSQESVRVTLAKVRKKLGTGPNRPTIDTEIGVGYRLVPPS
jgi:two-component system KDP operon response regulator KdpE